MADTATVVLTPESVEQIVEKLAARMIAAERPEVTLAEAMVITGFVSSSAFYRWCGRKRVKSIQNGRYRRQALLRAMGATS